MILLGDGQYSLFIFVTYVVLQFLVNVKKYIIYFMINNITTLIRPSHIKHRIYSKEKELLFL